MSFLKQSLKPILDKFYTKKTDIKDNLTSNDTDKPLSAKQGRELKTQIDNIVSGVTATDHNHDTTYSKITDIKDNLTSTDTNKPLSAKQGKELKTQVDAKVVTVEKTTTESGYAATYVVKQGGTAVGSKINIPKDFLVKSASLKTCTTANTPLSGLAVNDPYLDFVINTVGNDGTDSHIYINVKDLVDTYTAGTGLTLSNGQFSLTDASNYVKKSSTSGYIKNDGTIGTPTNTTYTAESTATNIKMNGTQSAGTLSTYARGDHVHPVDTSRAASSHTHPDTQINWNGTALAGYVSPLDMAMYEEFNSNRLAFFNGNNITVEYSTDGGSTWTSTGTTDQKRQLVTTISSFRLGNNSTTDYSKNQLRVTIKMGEQSQASSLYMITRKLMIYLCTCGANGPKVQLSYSTYKTPTTFTNIGSAQTVEGWSGWNSIPLNVTLGGFASQTGSDSTRIQNLRLTFTQTGGTANMDIQKIRLFGEAQWNAPSTLAKTGHLYSYDDNQNATFPAKIIKSGGTSSQFLKADGSVDSTTYVATGDSRLTNTRTPTDGTVTTAKIVDSAVTSAKIADGTIVNGDIANTTIQGGKLVNGTITATQLASNAVEEAKIKDGAVTTNKLGASAVTSAKIADGTITNDDIATQTIGMEKLAVHVDGGTSGTAGYVKLLRFTITGTYQDRPITFKVERRHATELVDCSITFKGASNNDPGLSSFVCNNEMGFTGNGSLKEIYLYKENTSTWSLIIRKSENYDAPKITMLYNPQTGITISKIKEFITTLPTASTTNPLQEIVGLNNVSEYIEGTHGTTATGTWTGVSKKIMSLTKGTVIFFKMTSAGSGNATLNLTLADGTTTGAKEVWYNANARMTTHFPQNTVLHLVYDGSKWINTAIQNTNNFDRLIYGSQITAGEALTANTLVYARSDGKYYKVASGGTLDIRYPVIYNNQEIASGNNHYNNHNAFNSGVNIQNTLSGKTITAYQNCYLEGTLSNNIFTISDNVFVSDGATTNGKYYILLGMALNTTTIRFNSFDKTIYKCIDSNHTLVPVELDIESNINLLNGTQAFSTPAPSGSSLNGTYNECNVRYVKNTSNTYIDFGWTIPYGQLESSGYYVLSFWAKTTTPHNEIRTYFYAGNVNSKRILSNSTYQGYNTAGGFGDGDTQFGINTEWKRYYVVYQLNTTTPGTSNKTLTIRLGNSSQTNNYDIYLAGVKFEKGTTPTKWSEHPNDSRIPVSHASTATTYGGGTSSNYGHVKVSDNYTSSAGNASQSVAASSKAVYDTYNTFAGTGTTKNAHTHSYISTTAGSVGASNLASNAVEEAKIKNDAVTSAKIADGTIVNANISTNAGIGATKIIDYSSTTYTNIISTPSNLNQEEINTAINLALEEKAPSSHTSVTANSSTLGHVKLGTTSGTAAEGNHTHTGWSSWTTILNSGGYSVDYRYNDAIKMAELRGGYTGTWTATTYTANSGNAIIPSGKRPSRELNCSTSFQSLINSVTISTSGVLTVTFSAASNGSKTYNFNAVWCYA